MTQPLTRANRSMGRSASYGLFLSTGREKQIDSAMQCSAWGVVRCVIIRRSSSAGLGGGRRRLGRRSGSTRSCGQITRNWQRALSARSGRKRSIEAASGPVICGRQSQREGDGSDGIEPAISAAVATLPPLRGKAPTGCRPRTSAGRNRGSA